MRKLLSVLLGVALLAAILAWMLGRSGTERAIEGAAEGSTLARPGHELTAPKADVREGAAATVPRRVAAGDAAVELGAIPAPELGENEALLVVRVTAVEDGTPVAGARAWIAGVETLNEQPETDERGIARVVVAAGKDHELMALVDFQPRGDWLPIPALAAGETREVLYEVLTRGDLHFIGRLVDEAGSPVGSAVVKVAGGKPGSWNEPVPVESDGFFELDALSSLYSAVVIQAPGFGWTTALITPGHETRASARVLALVPSARLHVEVRDVAGLGVPDLFVILRSDKSSLEQRESRDEYVNVQGPAWKQRTGADGTCVFEDMAARAPLSLEVRRRLKVLRREVDALVLEPGEERTLVVELGTGATIHGRMIDQTGAPVAGHAVWMKENESREESTFFEELEDDVLGKTETDAEGRFTFEDVRPATWFVGPAPGRNLPAEKALAPVAQSVVVTEATRDLDLELRVHRGLYASGIVLDPSGQPCARAGVHCFELFEFWFDTDEEGRFVVGPLVPGAYELQASSDGHAASDRVEVLAGTTDALLRLKPGGRVAGTVVDSSGTPIAAEVHLEPSERAEDERWGGIRASTADGRFELDRLAPGSYVLSATTDDGQIGFLPDVVLDAGAAVEGITLPVEPAARIRLVCPEGARSASFALFVGDWKASTAVASPGEPEVRLLPAGDVRVERVRYVGEGKLHDETLVRAVAGEELEARFE